jgi:hypothetical protein
MNRARKRKGSFQKARDKVEKREDELHQGMAIRGIDNREREKHKEEEKSKASSESSFDLASSTNFAGESVPQNEKTSHNNKDTIPIPEVFDSSKYDSMTAMKESADMEEGGHLKEVLSSVEKEERIEPTTTSDTMRSSMDANPPAAANTTADASQPNLEERAAILRDSREEQTVDKEEVAEVKNKKSDAEPHPSQSLADPHSIFWKDAARSWNNFYIEYVRSASEITKYWSDIFLKFWLVGYKRKK